MAERDVRILMCKPGLDGHWAGLIVVSKALRDAGFEVIYGGNMMPAEIATTAVQEDVGVVGLSILTANYMVTVPMVIEELRKQGKGDVLLLVGGIIFDEDHRALKKMGVHGIFIGGTPLEEIVEFVRKRTSRKAAKA
jgi:methylmalonyl-CoA mutase C-terminal domain/subunit